MNKNKRDNKQEINKARRPVIFVIVHHISATTALKNFKLPRNLTPREII